MPKNSNNKTSSKKDKMVGRLEKEYCDLVKNTENIHPGINSLLELYDQYQVSITQSQKYLQLYHPKMSSWTTNNTSPVG